MDKPAEDASYPTIASGQNDPFSPDKNRSDVVPERPKTTAGPLFFGSQLAASCHDIYNNKDNGRISGLSFPSGTCPRFLRFFLLPPFQQILHRFEIYEIRGWAERHGA